jgi:DNA helicase HerA-like ATPase
MGYLFIGKDIEKNEEVRLSANKSRSILVCGKRGSGKSYLLGVLIEELFNTKSGLVLVIDPMGIFHTMVEANNEQEDLVWDWNLMPSGFPIRILIPGNPDDCYGDSEITRALEDRGIQFVSLKINVSDVTPETWCELFGFGINDPMGITISGAIRNLKSIAKYFNIEQLIKAVQEQVKPSEISKDALSNRLEDARGWNIFNDSDEPVNFLDIFNPNFINVLDLHFLDSSRNGMRNLILSVIARDIFKRRSADRLREELKLRVSMPKVWLVIDEAHQFAPSGNKSSLCKDILIRWVKEGRQPGLSMVVATQQPSSVDTEILSQCDIILSHALTANDDVQAVSKIAGNYSLGEIKTSIQNLARTGEALFLDDLESSSFRIQVRPRLSKPGGSEHSQIDDNFDNWDNLDE